jgi:transcriptional regulator with XRE-family HTH domain
MVCLQLNKNNEFSLRLRELREKAKLTQQSVADCLGITKSAYGYYENGDSVPDVKTLYKMAELFGVSTDYLVLRTKVTTPSIAHRKICEVTGLSESEETIPAVAETSLVSMEELRELLIAVDGTGHDARGVITTFGVNRLSDLPVEQYRAMHQKLIGLLGNANA